MLFRSDSFQDDDTFAMQLTIGDKEQTINFSGTSTVNDVVNKLKSAGLNASFDESN